MIDSWFFGPDCRAGCVGASGRFVEKLTKTQHNSLVRLLTKQRLQKMKEQNFRESVNHWFFFTPSDWQVDKIVIKRERSDWFLLTRPQLHRKQEPFLHKDVEQTMCR